MADLAVRYTLQKKKEPAHIDEYALRRCEIDLLERGPREHPWLNTEAIWALGACLVGPGEYTYKGGEVRQTMIKMQGLRWDVHVRPSAIAFDRCAAVLQAHGDWTTEALHRTQCNVARPYPASGQPAHLPAYLPGRCWQSACESTWPEQRHALSRSHSSTMPLLLVNPQMCRALLCRVLGIGPHNWPDADTMAVQRLLLGDGARFWRYLVDRWEECMPTELLLLARAEACSLRGPGGGTHAPCIDLSGAALSSRDLSRTPTPTWLVAVTPHGATCLTTDAHLACRCRS